MTLNHWPTGRIPEPQHEAGSSGLIRSVLAFTSSGAVMAYILPALTHMSLTPDWWLIGLTAFMCGAGAIFLGGRNVRS